MELIKKKEAAELLAISESTLEKLIASKKLPSYKVTPKAVRIDRADVEAYLAARKTSVEPVLAPRRSKTPAVRPCTYVPGMKVV